MILKVLMGLAAAFGIFWTIKEKNTIPAIITIGMVIGIIMVFFPATGIQTSGFYTYMVFTGFAFIYGVTKRGLNIWTRLIITLMSASIFAYWLWVLNHWHGNTLLFAIFVLLVGLAAIISKAKLRNELGFLTILAVDAIAIIIENWMK